MPASLTTDGATVVAVDITPDGRFLFIQADHGTAGDPKTILAVYDRQTGRVERDADVHGMLNSGATISGDGQLLSIGNGGAGEFIISGSTFDRRTFSLTAEYERDYERATPTTTACPIPGKRGSA